MLSYYDNGKGEKCIKRDPANTGGVTEYRYRFPTACDIARCRQSIDAEKRGIPAGDASGIRPGRRPKNGSC